MTIAPHVLLITPDNNEPDWQEDEVEFDVLCPGIDAGGCVLWLECRQDHGDPDSWDTFDETDFHGVTHLFIDGMWMVETNRCLYQWAVGEYSDDSVWDMAREVEHVPGAYAVLPTWEGEYVHMALADEAVDL